MSVSRVSKIVLVSLVFALFALNSNGWTQRETESTSKEQSPRPGQLVYLQYCASCHGGTGKGDGPTAAALTRKPSDLTLLAKNNGGLFPDAKVMAIIEGTEPITAHGTRNCRYGACTSARGSSEKKTLQLLRLPLRPAIS